MEAPPPPSVLVVQRDIARQAQTKPREHSRQPQRLRQTEYHERAEALEAGLRAAVDVGRGLRVEVVTEDADRTPRASV
jgi:hypothetical protein